MGKVNTLLQILTLFLCIGLVVLVVDLTKRVDWLKSQLDYVIATAVYDVDDEDSVETESTSEVKTNHASSAERTEKPVVSSTPRKTPQYAYTASYKMEDRYVEDRLVLPDVKPSGEGIIVVNVSITWMGEVVKTSLGAETTITDEEACEAARKAALKTRFNMNQNLSLDNRQKGTITYKYSAQ